MLLAPQLRRKAARVAHCPYTDPMDFEVLQAMAKWPSVPAVYGWLALDRRGNWSIKGEAIGNRTVTAFIGRNYDRDGDGRWYFQNGPQRVFVRLDYTPHVLRVEPAPAGFDLVTHGGERLRECTDAFLDENGCLLVAFERGVGLVSDRDLASLLTCLRRADGTVASDEDLEQWMGGNVPEGACLDLGRVRLPLSSIRVREVPARFGFDPDPRPAPGEPEC